MKIFGFCLSLLLVAGLCFSINHSQAKPSVASIGIGDTTNPYCPAVYPSAPIIECPFGSSINYTCAQSCYDAYDSAISEAYSKACTKWNDITEAYENGLYHAAIDFKNCLSSANTHAQIVICGEYFTSRVNELKATRDQQRQEVTNELAASISAAVSNFEDCSVLCCEQ